MSNRFLCLLVFALMLFPAGCANHDKRPKVPAGQSHYMLGLSYLRQQNVTAALKEFIEAEKLTPLNNNYQNALAQTYHMKKAYREAETHYLKALKINSNDPEIQNNLAALYLDTGRYDEAADYFRKASSNILFEKQEIALTGLGVALFKKGDYFEAVTAYKEAIKRNASYPVSHVRLGDTYLAMDKADLALEEYQLAVSLAPNYQDAHYQAGMAYMKADEREKAAKSFLEVVRIDPATELGRQASDFLKLLE